MRRGRIRYGISVRGRSLVTLWLTSTTPPRCHLGKVARYDTVAKLGWKVDVRTHSVEVVIEKILHEDWEPPAADGSRREVPELEEENDCVVSIVSYLFIYFCVFVDQLLPRIVSIGSLENSRTAR